MKSISIIIIIFLWHDAHPQTNKLSISEFEREMQMGIEKELQHHDSMALHHFEKALLINASHQDLLIRTSRLYANIAGRDNEKSVRLKAAHKSIQYAKRGVNLNNQNLNAHLAYIISLSIYTDLINSPKEKLKYACIIKKEIDTSLKQDSLFAPILFALGKWHLSIASLSWMERTTCNVLFGETPKASVETAIKSFDKAILLEPNNILFQYNKALALATANKKKSAIVVLEHCLKMNDLGPNDIIRKNKCAALLKKLKT